MQIMSGHRPGFALGVTVCAMATLGALVAGALFASTQEHRIGRGTLLQTGALTAAEYGLSKVATRAEWNPLWNAAAAGPLATRIYLPGDGSIDTVRVVKLARGSLLVISEGRAGPPPLAQARHRIGALVALTAPRLDVLGALTVRAPASVASGAEVTGADAAVPEWTCPPGGAAIPDVVTVDSTHPGFGSPGWDSLTTAARTVLPAGAMVAPAPVYDGADACDLSAPLNWGDPLLSRGATSPCRDYFPILYARGDLHLSGGAGQGILLVDGDLTIDGGFHFVGPIIVNGTLLTTGAGARIHGVVFAGRAVLAPTTVLRFSRCALTRALLGAAAPSFTHTHSWTEMY